MDPSCLEHRLTKDEHRRFERDGYIVIEEALSSEYLADLTIAVDEVEAEHRRQHSVDPGATINPFDFVGRSELFWNLVDWPRTFPKVWGILGWHIQLYHSHIMIVPPASMEAEPKRMNWHQDSSRLNWDLETDPRPRVSVKVGYFLTDTTAPETGNVFVIPGSHLRNVLELPDDGLSEPPGAVPLTVGAGSAIIFARRVWHASGRNLSSLTRRVLYYGYSYRWLKPRDDMTVDHLLADADPIRRQLLGAAPTGNYGFTSPQDEDVPLRDWIRTHIGKQAIVP